MTPDEAAAEVTRRLEPLSEAERRLAHWLLNERECDPDEVGFDMSLEGVVILAEIGKLDLFPIHPEFLDHDVNQKSWRVAFHTPEEIRKAEIRLGWKPS